MSIYHDGGQASQNSVSCGGAGMGWTLLALKNPQRWSHRGPSQKTSTFVELTQ